jgi:diguanylate cyclase (GGDEF)-like protein
MTSNQVSDFRTKTTLGLALTSVFLLTPFSLYQLVAAGNVTIGAMAMSIVIIFAFNAWRCKRGQYSSMLTFLILVPVIIFYLAYAFQEVGTISLYWCYPAVLSFYFMLPERQAWIANMLFLIVVMPQAWNVMEFQHAIRLLVSLLMVIIFSGVFMRVITNQQQKLEGLALTDPLTGLLNRTSLQETLEHASVQSKRLGLPATMILLDLDHFKKINDTLGHDAGDAVLQHIGSYLKGRMRHSDKVFRLGGEEFLIILYDTDADNGHDIAEELRHGISSLTTLADHKLTASIGLATLTNTENSKQWMKRCDENLYCAKSSGRDTVVC